MVADSDHLEALRQLDEVLGELEKLVRKCGSAQRITEADEALHSELIAKAQVLHGRLSSLLGVMVVQQFGRREDAFQSILGNVSVSGLFSPEPVANFWLTSLKAAQSVVRQTIGKLEEMERQGRLGLAPEVVAKYQSLINVLERARQLTARAARLASWPTRILGQMWGNEDRPLKRIAIVAGGVVAFLAGLVAILGFLGVRDVDDLIPGGGASSGPVELVAARVAPIREGVWNEDEFSDEIDIVGDEQGIALAVTVRISESEDQTVRGVWLGAQIDEPGVAQKVHHIQVALTDNSSEQLAERIVTVRLRERRCITRNTTKPLFFSGPSPQVALTSLEGFVWVPTIRVDLQPLFGIWSTEVGTIVTEADLIGVGADCRDPRS